MPYIGKSPDLNASVDTSELADGSVTVSKLSSETKSVLSASFVDKAGSPVSGTFSTRASVSSSLTSGNESVQFDQVTGSTALFTGRMTVGEVFTQYVSSSVLVESSGSTKLGNESTDLHQVTGSMSILSGSLITKGTAAAQEKISGSAYSTGSFGTLYTSPGANVGIGTTNPTARLHLYTAADYSQDFKISNDDVTMRMYASSAGVF